MINGFKKEKQKSVNQRCVNVLVKLRCLFWRVFLGSSLIIMPRNKNRRAFIFIRAWALKRRNQYACSASYPSLEDFSVKHCGKCSSVVE